MPGNVNSFYGQRQFLTDNVSSLRTMSVPYGQRHFPADNVSSLRTTSVPCGQCQFLTDNVSSLRTSVSYGQRQFLTDNVKFFCNQVFSGNDLLNRPLGLTVEMTVTESNALPLSRMNGE